MNQEKVQMKIKFSNDPLHLIATPLPEFNPLKNYGEWVIYVGHFGVCLGITDPLAYQGRNLQLFSKITIHDMNYVIIGHSLSNSAAKGEWQNLYLVKEQVFYNSDWRTYIDYHMELI